MGTSAVHRQQALTFVELLIVVAVLAVLAGLLLPVLIRGKTAAHRVKCVSNLRQLGLAAQMYADEHDGRTFNYSFGSTNGGKLYWFGWIQDGPEQTREFDLTQGVLWPYLHGRGLELCPSLQYDDAQFKRKAKGAAYGYGYNLYLAGGPAAPPVHLSSLSRSADIVLLADAAQVNTFQAPASPDKPLLEEFYYVNATEPTAHFRHHRTANAAFCDGHVDRELPKSGSLDPRLPNARVGCLREECLQVP